MTNPPKNYFEENLIFHKKIQRKLETIFKTPINTREDLSLAYTSVVTVRCLAITKNPEDVLTSVFGTSN
jgi:malate dehydrogenase (oxaloacetate-decarboxylating)